MPRARWRIRLAAAAEADFESILDWTAENFGPRLAGVYRATILSAIRALTDGPAIIGARSREDLGTGVRTLHIARGRRAGRHFVVFRQPESHVIEVLRILYDAMDLARHVPTDDSAYTNPF